MTEKDIIALLGKKRRYETEIAIMRDCSDDLLDSEHSAAVTTLCSKGDFP